MKKLVIAITALIIVVSATGCSSTFGISWDENGWSIEPGEIEISVDE